MAINSRVPRRYCFSLNLIAFLWARPPLCGASAGQAHDVYGGAGTCCSDHHVDVLENVYGETCCLGHDVDVLSDFYGERVAVVMMFMLLTMFMGNMLLWSRCSCYCPCLWVTCCYGHDIDVTVDVYGETCCYGHDVYVTVDVYEETCCCGHDVYEKTCCCGHDVHMAEGAAVAKLLLL